MEQLIPWLTPALIVGLFTWLRSDINRQFDQTNGRLQRIENRVDRIENRVDRIENRVDRIENQIDRIESRIDTVGRDIADLRDRTGALEGRLATFMSERRDPNAA